MRRLLIPAGVSAGTSAGAQSVGASPWLKNCATWIAPHIELPETSLSHLIDEAVRTVPPQGGAGVLGATTTYAELGDQIARGGGSVGWCAGG